MSWARNYPVYESLGDDKRQRGYTYKLCPYSTAYRDKFRYQGRLYFGVVNGEPSYLDGDFVVGNSTREEFFGLDYSSYACSVHTTTSGRMISTSNPPGWICDDPNCHYVTTVSVGNCYREE